MLEAILADGEFFPRAITRNTTSDSAQKLSHRGVQVVAADLGDVDALRAAFAGCEGVFAVSEIKLEAIVLMNYNR